MAHKNESNWSPYKARKQKAGKGSPSSHSQRSPQSKGASARPSSSFAERGGERGRHRLPAETFTFQEADERIADYLSHHGFPAYPNEKRKLLTEFYFLLMEAQKTRNLTRITTLRDFAIKHYVDSLIVTQLWDLQFPLLDMGTGPGFPGIPLRIHFDDGQILLGEGVQNRVEFLKSAREKLNLKKLDILGKNITLETFYPVKTVITRAVEDSRNTLGNVLHSLQSGGHAVLMKGPNCDPEIDMALKEYGEYYELTRDIPYVLPNTDNRRRLLVFKKTKAAPLPNFEDLDLAWERQVGDIKKKKR